MSEQWINRTEIKSQSSNRKYIVAQHATKRHWSCSCPSWKVRRRCKHLVQLGLPCHEQPFEPKKAGYLDGYETYEGEPGTPEEARKSFFKTLRKEVEAAQALTLDAIGRLTDPETRISKLTAYRSRILAQLQAYPTSLSTDRRHELQEELKIADRLLFEAMSLKPPKKKAAKAKPKPIAEPAVRMINFDFD